MQEENSSNCLNQDNSRPGIVLIMSFITGIIFDILFNGKLLGLSYPVFVVVFYFTFYISTNIKFKKNNLIIILLALSIATLSAAYFLFSNDLFRVLNFMAIPLLVVAHTLIITGKNKYILYDIRFACDAAFGFFVYPFKHIFKPAACLGSLISGKKGRKDYSLILKVLIGLAVSIPLIFIIISLLASADQVFGHFLENIPDFFDRIRIGEIISHIIIALFASLLIFSYLSSLNRREDSDKQHKSPYLPEKAFDPAIVITILIAVNTVYVLFTVIQFSYLFGSLKDALPEGLTYSEYARRGFFELVTATIINLSILLTFINLTKDKCPDKIKIIISALYSLLVACTLVMLVSAHFRMSLYEEEYGYTYLRILTHSFMVFLSVIFLITLIKIWKRDINLLKPYIITGLVAYMAINYINIDVIIAKNNIERYKNSNKIDVEYLSRLSYDAVHDMVGLLDDKNGKGEYGNKVAEETRKRLSYISDKLNKDYSWQSFNLSRYRAKKLLNGYRLK